MDDTQRKYDISIEAFNLAIKEAVYHAELRIQQQFVEQLNGYKRLCAVLIIVLSVIALCSVLLNIKLFCEGLPALPALPALRQYTRII